MAKRNDQPPHIRTLINVASESDDIDLIYKHLRMMRTVVNKAVPAPTLRQRAAAEKKSGRDLVEG